MTNAKRGHLEVRLKVRSALQDDVYKDIVRVTERDRADQLRTGRVHRFKTTTGAAYFILRGSAPENDGKILMDEASRSRLNLPSSAECEFDIQEVGFWGELRWGWSATDPAYRIAARLGVLSFLLAIFAAVPAVWALLTQYLLPWLTHCLCRSP